MVLEALHHEASSFVTLTYADRSLPTVGRGVGTLCPGDATGWLKRFRKKVEPLRVRYFLVGEYGGVTQRPHYHAVLFGYPACVHGGSRYSLGLERCCHVCDTLRDTWGLGIVHSGSFSIQSAAYVAGYVLKKRGSDFGSTLAARVPEFTRMSLRPGIGAGAMGEVARSVGNIPLARFGGDVPSALRHGGRIFPLGRYLRRRLRVECGRDPGAPEVTIEAIKEELRTVREFAFDNSLSFAEVASRVDDVRVAQLEGRMAIRERRNKV